MVASHVLDGRKKVLEDAATCWLDVVEWERGVPKHGNMCGIVRIAPILGPVAAW